MKKALLILLFICIFSLVGCSEESEPIQNDNSSTRITTNNVNSSDAETDNGWKNAQDAADTMMMMSAAIN